MNDAMDVAGCAGDARLGAQVAFLLEADRLKSVQRQNPVGDGSRRENSAEHSWHLALCVLVLAEHMEESVDVARAVTLALVHDLVEIDAGDAYIYDTAAREAAQAKEEAAAARVFGLLPGDQGGALRGAWAEFEARETPEARLAYAADRVQPLLMNAATGGGGWRRHGTHAGQVRALMATVVGEGLALRAFIDRLIDAAVACGALPADPGAGG